LEGKGGERRRRRRRRRRRSQEYDDEGGGGGKDEKKKEKNNGQFEPEPGSQVYRCISHFSTSPLLHFYTFYTHLSLGLTPFFLHLFIVVFLLSFVLGGPKRKKKRKEKKNVTVSLDCSFPLLLDPVSRSPSFF